MLRQNDLTPPPGAKHARKRVGRGLGSGHGRFSGRGQKGQKGRAGPGIHPYFEGGQLPLHRRLPGKRGFTNIFKTEYSVVNIGKLNVFEAGSVVGLDQLTKAGLVSSSTKPVKILGTGELDRALTVKADGFSGTAREKILAAGGTVEVGSGTKAN
ncbi:MAG TPA: 50S ribosomal protein L15 [Dehalococcoidia bacterium]|nr:50S ribosomal protein L15 [Dehalococcoidia bacterium]